MLSKSCNLKARFVGMRSEMSTDYNQIKNPHLYAIPRGTGGRSSFNGIVATVFGASGFLGRYVCNRLARTGTQVIVAHAGTHYDVRRLKVQFDLGQIYYQPFDLKEKDTIMKCIRHSNVVINLIGRDWETKNFTFDDVHVKGALEIANACIETGIDNLIHISALNAAEEFEGNIIPGGSEFLISKYEGEKCVRELFPNVIVFRPSDMFGSEDRFLRYFASSWRRQLKWLPLYKKGEETEKQPVYVGDVASGIVSVCKNSKKHRGKIFQAVGPSRYYLSELVDYFYNVMRKDKSWGFRRYDIDYDPFFKPRISLQEKTGLYTPPGSVTLDRLERESVSDVVDEKLPTLEDLGVRLTDIEELVPWELRPFRAYNYYDAELDEFRPPCFPKKIKKNAEPDTSSSSSSSSDEEDEKEESKETK